MVGTKAEALVTSGGALSSGDDGRRRPSGAAAGAGDPSAGTGEKSSSLAVGCKQDAGAEAPSALPMSSPGIVGTWFGPSSCFCAVGSWVATNAARWGVEAGAWAVVRIVGTKAEKPLASGGVTVKGDDGRGRPSGAAGGSKDPSASTDATRWAPTVGGKETAGAEGLSAPITSSSPVIAGS